MIILRVVSGKAWSKETLTQKHSGPPRTGRSTTKTGIEFTSAMEFSSGNPGSTVYTTFDSDRSHGVIKKSSTFSVVEKV